MPRHRPHPRTAPATAANGHRGQRDLESLRQIAEHIPGMVYRAHYPSGRDAQAYFSFVSAGARRIFGVEPEAALADPRLLRRLRHPDDADRVDQEVRRAIASGSPLAVEYRLVVDGQVKWVSLSSSVAGSDGEEQIRVGVLLDVTAHRRADDLRRERDSAENERQQMTRFLSRVSHELRTPLNGILGFAQLIEMDPATPPGHRRWVTALLDSGRHLLDLVNEVLDIAGAQSGQMVFDLAEVDLAAALRESWAMVQSQASTLIVGGIPEPGAAPVWVRADHRRLVQVLCNLLSNAVKYNRPGGRIDVALRVGDRMVDVDVADSGVGIAEPQLERLFTPFERLGAQRGPVPGTGLGLALARQLAMGMGGALGVASRLGHGSTFTLRLPRARI